MIIINQFYVEDYVMPLQKNCLLCNKVYKPRKDNFNVAKFCSHYCSVKNNGFVTAKRRQDKWEQESNEEFLKNLNSSFEKFVSKKDSCWEWTGGTGGKGSEYGHFRFRGKRYKAHRVSFMIHKGEIPPKLYVLHKCDVRHCVNPEHLFLGTHTDNMNDMKSKKRQHGNQKFTIEQILKIREQLKSGIPAYRIAKENNVSNTCIFYIKHNMSWKNLI